MSVHKISRLKKRSVLTNSFKKKDVEILAFLIGKEVIWKSYKFLSHSQNQSLF